MTYKDKNGTELKAGMRVRHVPTGEMRRIVQSNKPWLSELAVDCGQGDERYRWALNEGRAAALEVIQ